MYESTHWKPQFGPSCTREGCCFRLLAKQGAQVELILEGSSRNSGNAENPTEKISKKISMAFQPSGLYQVTVPEAGVGTLYRFFIDGQGPYPDPASRFQPQGVHGPSQVMAASGYHWKHTAFHAPALRALVLYELHIGTFTPQGTYLSAIEKLDILRDLGVTAIELMPVADSAGGHNWGYDGVAIYAPSRAYGTPDELRQLVDAAHQRGLAVFLDVVYNHLGPDGAYHSVFAPQFYTGKHKTPWGDGLNFDDKDCTLVREFFLDNAQYWIREFNFDGLRLDATHAIQDASARHVLAEMTSRVHAAAKELKRTIHIIAEDDRNQRNLVIPIEQGGMGFDAVWADDFHHHMRRHLAGDHDGYFVDFDGTTEHIAETLRDGWYFKGQFSSHADHARGTPTDGLEPQSRVICIQNHDQVGNRAFGERLSTQIQPPEYRAASALLLLAPETPLLFMGQEWAAPEPFQFFTDHSEPLGRLVTEGRRREFAHFAAFSNPSDVEKIPDPQAKETFLRSKLDWKKLPLAEHAACWRWYQALLQLRKKIVSDSGSCEITNLDDATFELQWKTSSQTLTAVISLEGARKLQQPHWAGLHLLLSSEDQSFCVDPCAMAWDQGAGTLTFLRSGGVVLSDAAIMNARKS